MLLHVENCIKVFFLFFLTNVCGRSVPTKDLLSRLLANSDHGPKVIFLDPEQAKTVGFKIPEPEKRIKPADVDNFDIALDEYQPLQEYSGDPGENDAYVLYSIIQATQKQEQIDPKATSEFEQTKHILRTMFESRCMTRQICENKCEQKPETKHVCEVTCQKVYDKFDVCEKPKPVNECTTPADECTTPADLCTTPADECTTPGDQCTTPDMCQTTCGVNWLLRNLKKR